MRWNFNELGLEIALQVHYGKMVKAKAMTPEQARLFGSAVKTFLRSPDAGILRLHPISAAAMQHGALLLAS